MILFCLNAAFLVAKEKGAEQKEYLDPAIIPKLNWVLLITEIEFKKEGLQSDNYKLLKFVDFCTVKDRHHMVGITFMLNRGPFLELDKKTLETTFIDFVEEVTEAIQRQVPEVKLGRDIFAIFVVKIEEEDYREIAQYRDGKLFFFGLGGMRESKYF